MLVDELLPEDLEQIQKRNNFQKRSARPIPKEFSIAKKIKVEVVTADKIPTTSQPLSFVYYF